MLNDQFIVEMQKIIDARLSSNPVEERGLHELGHYLRSLRRYRGLSRAFVAQNAGISEAYLIAIENGLMPADKISDNVLSHLAMNLKIDVAELAILLDRAIQPNKHKTWYSIFYLAITDESMLKAADILLLIFLLALLVQNNFEEWMINTGIWVTLIGGGLFLLFQKIADIYWRQAGIQGNRVLTMPDSGVQRQSALRMRYAIERRFRLMSLLASFAATLAILPIYIPWLRGNTDTGQIIIQSILVGIFLARGYRILAKSYYEEFRRWQNELQQLKNLKEQSEARHNVIVSMKLARQSTLFAFVSETLVAIGIIVLFSGHISQLIPFLFQIFTLGTLYMLLRLAPRLISGSYLVPIDLLHLAQES